MFSASHVYPTLNDRGTVQSDLGSLSMGRYSITRISRPLQCTQSPYLDYTLDPPRSRQ